MCDLICEVDSFKRDPFDPNIIDFLGGPTGDLQIETLEHAEALRLFYRQVKEILSASTATT